MNQHITLPQLKCATVLAVAGFSAHPRSPGIILGDGGAPGVQLGDGG
jgi:hypothetical protein